MNPVKPFCCVLLLAFLLAVHPCISQLIKPAHYNYSVKHFGEEAGLFQHFITCILPDKNDFLLIGTEAGVMRFNGSQFTPVKKASGLIKTSFSRVRAIYRMSNDTIMAFSLSSRMVAFIVNNKIVSIKDQKVESQGMLFRNLPYTITAPPYIKGSNSSPLKSAGMGEWNSEMYSYIGASYNEDTFTVVLKKGIGIYTKKGMIGKINIDHINPSKVIFSKDQIIYIDEDNYVNYYSPQAELKKRTLFAISAKKQLTFFNNYLGNYFYCIADTTLYRIDVGSSGDFNISRLLQSVQNSTDISNIYEKDNNTIVVGTARNGLYVYKRIYFSMTDPLPNQMSTPFYTQQLLSDSQTIFTGKGQFFKNNHNTGKTAKGIHWNMYSSLKDRNGDYWYVKDSCIVHTRQIGVKENKSICVPGVYCFLLLEDKEGRIWVASSQGLGYLKNGLFTEVKISGVPTDIITRMRQDSSGKYYIGTRHGLFVWDDINAKSGKAVAGLEGYDIMFIWPESNGMTWITTFGNGIFLISKDGITSFPENNSLAYVHAIIEDAKGYFWMPTINGLLVTTRESLVAYSKNKNRRPFFYRFSINDGLRTSAFLGGGEPAFLRLPKNEISLASVDGLVRFCPSQVNFSFSNSPILVDNIQLDSTEINPVDAFDVGSKVKNISFSISSSFWGDAENDLLEYQLVEKKSTMLSDQWLPTDLLHKINLFSLSSGQYQLLIRKRKGLGGDDYIYKAIDFHVLPKWYQTNGFLAALVMVTIFLTIGIFSLRKNYYRKANEILKEKVNVATTELRQMNNTLEKKVEERTFEIQQAERKFRDLVEKSLVGVYVIKDGRLPYVNPRFAEIFGYTQTEITQAPSLNFIVYEADRELVAENVRKRMVGDIEWVHYEMRGLTKDGRIIYAEVFGRITQYEGGKAIIGTLIDITEKKIAHEQRELAIDAMEKSEANLNTIFLNTDTAYILLDTDLKIIAYNQRASDYIEKELHGTLATREPFTNYMQESRRQQFLENARNVMLGNQVSYEKSYQQPNVNLNWYHVRKFPVLDSAKNLLGMMIAISDITEKKLLEQEILDQKVEEQKKVMKAILSGEEKERNKIGQELHDNINQILAGTKLYLGTIEHSEPSSNTILKQSIQFLDDAIEEIRSLSKYKVTPPKKASLLELLQTLIDHFYIATNIEVEYCYKGTAHLIYEDLKLNIYRIVQEQINNIIKHANAKIICIHVDVSEKNIHLLISDDGVGFEQKDKKTGIGLSNMANRVELFNGTINIESSPGSGCKIEIELPLQN